MTDTFNAFEIKNGVVTVDDRPLTELTAGFETPCFVYNLKHIRSRVQFMRETLTTALDARLLSIHYAVKANSRHSILRLLCELGASVDVVSDGEIAASLDAGFQPSDVLFSGVGKTKKELRTAVHQGVKQINVESLGELERLIRMTEELGITAQNAISIGLRFNPNVCPETHPYITTGLKENKFGLETEAVRDAVKLLCRTDRLTLRGLSLHIGSQLLDLAPLDEAIERSLALHDELSSSRAAGPWDRFDAGGGVGIDYTSFDERTERDAIHSLGEIFTKRLRPRVASGSLRDIMIEPGRWLVARAGLLLTEVQYVKSTSHKTFVIVDGGMNLLLRPALYEAEHRIEPLHASSINKTNKIRVDVVGPICESADVLGRDRLLPSVNEGDRLAVFDSGAYGRSMSSNYNLRGWPDEHDLNF
ncbi:MAG: diaminopimelate decarboxylase [Bdellovibrionaceae bacterium]|nr:diaminopimelate decarboxylase [Pseudobdellovibrionaceae bacterium]